MVNDKLLIVKGRFSFVPHYIPYILNSDERAQTPFNLNLSLNLNLLPPYQGSQSSTNTAHLTPSPFALPRLASLARDARTGNDFVFTTPWLAKVSRYGIRP